MDWNLLAIAALLVLSGIYMLEAALCSAVEQIAAGGALKPARSGLERAWQAEPVQVFMRQVLASRHRRTPAWR